MRNPLTRFALVFPLVFAFYVGPVALSTGCGTFGKNTYRATATATVTVDAAMSAWGRWVKEHKPPAESEIKVKNAFEKYQRSVTLVASAGSAYLKAKQTPGPPGLSEAQIKFNAAVAAASSALADLTNLILSFGVKL